MWTVDGHLAEGARLLGAIWSPQATSRKDTKPTQCPGKAPVLLSRFVGVETFRVQLLCYKETINLSKIADESKCLVLGTIEEL